MRHKKISTLGKRDIKRLRAYFTCAPEVIAAFVFGSRAMGGSHSASDLDIAVLLSKDIPTEKFADYRMHLSVDLACLLRQDADVTIFNQAPLILKHEILKYGQRVYEHSNRSGRVEEAQALIQYFDFLPIFERCKEGMLKKIRERVYGSA